MATMGRQKTKKREDNMDFAGSARAAKDKT